MGTNPFDRVGLGYEGLFGPRTMFYHLVPNASEASVANEVSITSEAPVGTEGAADGEVVRDSEGLGQRATLVERLQVPVLDLSGTRWVEAGTVAAVVMGFLWVAWVLARVAFAGSRLDRRRYATGTKKKQ